MKTHYHYNTGLNLHVVEFTFQEGRIDSLEPLEATPRIEGVLVCPDETTARTIAATAATLYHLKVVVEMLGPEWFEQSEIQKAIEHIQTIEPNYQP